MFVSDELEAKGNSLFGEDVPESESITEARNAMLLREKSAFIVADSRVKRMVVDLKESAVAAFANVERY